jgi:hypothetical protein
LSSMPLQESCSTRSVITSTLHAVSGRHESTSCIKCNKHVYLIWYFFLHLIPSS